MTTIPDRLENENPFGFKHVIYSLLTMKYLAYEIHLNIPEIHKKTGRPYVIPNWLQQMNGRGIKIFRTEDYGTLTKLYPTIQRVNDPEQIIIVVDDDLIYESRLIEEHLKLRNKDNSVVWGFAGLNNMGEKYGGPMDRFVIGVNQDTRVGIIEHYKSVSYTRKMFDDDFNDEFIVRGWADDHLVSAYLGMKGIKKMVAQTDYIPKYKDHDEWRKYGVVESFPVIKHSHNISRKDGCNLFRTEGIEPMDKDLFKYLI